MILMIIIIQFIIDIYFNNQCVSVVSNVYCCLNIVIAVLFKVFCSDHTYTTIRVPVAASVREVIAAVTDKLGSGEELLLIHLGSAGGESTQIPTHPRTHMHARTDAHTHAY